MAFTLVSFSRRSTAVAAMSLMLLAHLATAHGGMEMGNQHMDMDMDMDMSAGGGHGSGNKTSAGGAVLIAEQDYPPTYFALIDHRSLIYAHIALMAISWIIVLPVAVMLSIAQSRFTLPTQFVFLAVNGVGVLLATMYDAQTPDLYPGNTHHKFGWIVTWIIVGQVLVGVVGVAAKVVKSKRPFTGDEGQAFLDDMANEQWRDVPTAYSTIDQYRLSNDSGQGTEPESDSLRSSSASTDGDDQPLGRHKEYDSTSDEMLGETRGTSFLGGKLGRNAARMLSSRAWYFLDILYRTIDRVILPFGFVALLTGVATMGRFFEGHDIFSGLAHWVKGGVFFWLGLFTLGRWSGSFAEIGWAWNLNPRSRLHSRRWRPSAEFVESALIFFYGSTNIFLEHLGSWGGDWSSQDLEHLSVTVLFIGGGLCGMLIESSLIRRLLNTTVLSVSVQDPSVQGQSEWGEPESYDFSLNPIPALVILLVGIMMSSHQQETMIASMVHKQWGNLLFCASLARLLTYVLLFLRPPRSVLPSRPPTELLAAFGLIAGGIIFMASSSDTIDGMIHYKLDAMFFYTVTLGLVGILMAWEIAVLSLKGWAVRHAAASKLQSFA